MRVAVKRADRMAFMPDNGMFYTRRYCGHSVTGGQKERKRRRRGIADKYSPSLLPDVSAEESVRFRDLDRSRREKKVKGAKRPFGDIKENGHYLRRPPRRTSPITLRIDWLDGIHLLPKFFDFLIDNFSLERANEGFSLIVPRFSVARLCKGNTSQKVDYTNWWGMIESVRVIDILVNGTIFSVKLQIFDKSTTIMVLFFYCELFL